MLVWLNVTKNIFQLHARNFGFITLLFKFQAARYSPYLLVEFLILYLNGGRSLGASFFWRHVPVYLRALASISCGEDFRFDDSFEWKLFEVVLVFSFFVKHQTVACTPHRIKSQSPHCCKVQIWSPFPKHMLPNKNKNGLCLLKGVRYLICTSKISHLQ